MLNNIYAFVFGGGILNWMVTILNFRASLVAAGAGSNAPAKTHWGIGCDGCRIDQHNRATRSPDGGVLIGIVKNDWKVQT